MNEFINLLRGVDSSYMAIATPSNEIILSKKFRKLIELSDSIESISVENFIETFFSNEKSQFDSLIEYNIPITFLVKDKLLKFQCNEINKNTYLITAENISKIEKLKNDLSESKNQLNFVLEKNNMGIFRINPKTKELECDPFWRTLHNINSFEKINFSWITEKLKCEDSNSNILEKEIYTLKESSLKELDSFRYKVNKKWLNCKLYKEFLVDLEQEFILGICSDITLQVENEAQLQEEKKTAEIQAKNKANFLANMSHEIRTPLNGIIGISEILKEEKTLNPKIKNGLSTIDSCSNNLLQIINDILDFSKIDSGNMEIDPIKFNLKDSLDDVYKMFSSLCNKKGIDLILEYPISQELFFGDENRIKQIIINLISNSLKFTNKGHIKIYVSYENDIISISVSDTGIGIDKENLELVFEAFNQEDASVSRNFGGTGLGLNICKKLSNMMKGDISLKSEKGKGSNFTLSIPLKSTSESIKNNATYNNTNINFNNANLLLVEDNQTNQEVISMLLEKYNFNIDIANNGQEALDKIKPNKYKLILMDIQMPILDGYSTISILKDRFKPQELPSIAALTANALNEEKQKCISLGFDAFLTKPLTRKKLENFLSSMSNDSRNNQNSIFQNNIDTGLNFNFEKILLDYGDEELARTILSKMREGIHKSRTKISTLYKSKDYSSLHREFHTLKSLLKTVYTKQSLIHSCISFEDYYKNTPEEYKDEGEINSFLEKLDLLVKEIKEY